MKTINKRNINIDDLCNLISLESHNKSIDTVENVLISTYKVILSQLELNGRICIPSFGVFEIKERKTGERLVGNPNGGEPRVVYVPPKYNITFRPSSVFDLSVNENNFRIAKKVSVQKKQRKNYYDIGSTTVDMLNKANKRGRNNG